LRKRLRKIIVVQTLKHDKVVISTDIDQSEGLSNSPAQNGQKHHLSPPWLHAIGQQAFVKSGGGGCGVDGVALA